MDSIERELNAYLFLEFGIEGDDDAISETWPFSLRRLGEIGVNVIFEFDDDDEPYFAISGPCLDFMSKGGMTIDDLALQFAGSEWIAAQHPVSLEDKAAQAMIPFPPELNAGARWRNWEDTPSEIHARRSWRDCFFGAAAGTWDCFAFQTNWRPSSVGLILRSAWAMTVVTQRDACHGPSGSGSDPNAKVATPVN